MITRNISPGSFKIKNKQIPSLKGNGNLLIKPGDKYAAILGPLKLNKSTAGDNVGVSFRPNTDMVVNWSNHSYKHFPPKKMSWKGITKSTKNGSAKYKPGIDVEALERQVWKEGTSVTNGKVWKVKKFNKVIGASGGTIRGQPITEAEYRKHLK